MLGYLEQCFRYKRRLRDDRNRRRAIQRIAPTKQAYGYRMIARKRSRKKPAQQMVVAPTICWSMDLVSDALIDGRTMRMPLVVDDVIREGVELAELGIPLQDSV